jgi:hypothetical protein
MLMRIYEKKGDKEMVRECAKIIINKPEKIISPQSILIKQAARNILEQ